MTQAVPAYWRTLAMVAFAMCAIQAIYIITYANNPTTTTKPPWMQDRKDSGAVKPEHHAKRLHDEQKKVQEQVKLRQQQQQQQQANNDGEEQPVPVFIDWDNIGNTETIMGTILPPLSQALHPRPTPTVLAKMMKKTRFGEVSEAEEGIPFQRASMWTVFILTLISALASGLGAFPFFFVDRVSPYTLGVCNASAAGLMLSASISLTYEGLSYSVLLLFLGIVCGIIFIVLSQRVLERYESLRVGNLEGLDARKVLLIMGVMTLHSTAEGVGMGMSFGGGEALGFFISIAITIHNIPEGLAIALVMVPRGVSPTAAMLWGAFSSLPQPLMAMPSFLFVEIFEVVLPWGLGFAAGAMVWMVFTELLPDAMEESKSLSTVVFFVCFALAIMATFQYFVLEPLISSAGI